MLAAATSQRVLLPDAQALVPQGDTVLFSPMVNQGVTVVLSALMRP